MTNCRNCGAVLTGHICEYCGTRYPIVTSGREEVVLYVDGEPYIYEPEPLPVYPLDTDTITVSANLYDIGLVSPNELKKMIELKRRKENGRNN